MISFLQGTLQSKSKDRITILTQGGVGYQVRVSRVMAAEAVVGASAGLFTYLKVSETALELFGFATEDARSFFELLLTVKGVGPKGAMNILSLGSIDEIQDAISRGDAKYLSAVQGMGKKTAERLCVELKSKIKTGSAYKNSDAEEKNGDILSDVVDGLVSLGYTASDARDIVKQLDGTDKTVEELLKEALQRKS